MRIVLLAASGAGVLAPPPRRASRAKPELEPWDPPPPGGNGGDGGNGGGGGGGDDGGEDEGGGREAAGDRPEAFPVGPLEVAFALLIVAICTLFLTFLAASLYLRRTAPEWPPAGTPRVPGGLWWSTLILFASGVAMARAVRVLRLGATARARRWLTGAMGLGCAFLVAQGILWRELLTGGLHTSNAYGTIFYSLTGLHAVHVMAGLVYMELVRRKLACAPGADATRASAVFCGVYWHLMGAIWLALFATLSFLY